MKEPKPGDTESALSAFSSISAISPVLLTEIFHSFEDAVVVTDTGRRMVYVNAATEQLFGYTRDELYGQETKLLYADDSDFSEQGQKRFNVASRLAAENYRVVYRRSDGEAFLGVTTGATMRSAEGEVVGFMGIVRPARSAEQSLDALQKIHNITSDVAMSHDQKIESLLRAGLDHFGLDIAILSRISGNDYTVEACVDLKGELEPSTRFDVSGTYCVHTLSENKTVGFHFAGKSDIQNHPCYQNFKLESYIGTPIRLRGELYGTINFSSPFPVEPFCKDDYILMELLSDTVSYLLYTKMTEEKLEALARVDELTGLPNRRAALAGFARVASGIGRKTDFCGRVGGEEFVFVLPGSNLEAGEALGNGLRERLAAEPIDIGNGELITLTVSGGLAMLEKDEAVESILARADEAMCKAKRQGRDRVCW
ncbi:sensor domain-containing diguanylate cyclase [Marinobacter sediminicola]|uniref:sensor domain-containing diguanylate cyclase n=1 Tax=Marinobacter sediminicola TaxID=3072994 RepID=UPI0028119A00|nr:diguanylate cyclase [Marinobacter sp. F26243]